MNQGNILYTVKSGVGIITINRPEKANAFDFNLLDGLYNSLIEADKDRKVKCILLKSTGEKIFSAGFDLSSSGLGSAEFSSKIFELGGKISQTMVLMKKPIIVQVQGSAIGFGFILIMASDLKIFADKPIEEMYFRMPEIALKGYPRAGAVVLPLLAFGINYAKKILLTADKFGLDDLKNFNFPTRIFPSDRLEPETWNFVKNFSKHPFHVSSLIKSALTMMDKNIIKKCFELEDIFAEAAHEKKNQDEIDSFIQSLYDNNSKR